MRTPTIRTTEAARQAIQAARMEAGEDAAEESLRLAIGPRFEVEFFFGSEAKDDIAVASDGITILLDPPSAARADGISIDFVDGPDGSGFKIDNPNKPGGKRRIELERNCEATLIPSGEKAQLARGESVILTQALGGSFTVRASVGLARIAAADADALGFKVNQASPEPADAGEFELERVIAQLRAVFDPEIPVNVVDLGLIYACEAHPIEGGGQRVEIKMSMTAPGCGMGDVLREDARARVQTVPGVAEVDVEIVWDPPWDKSRMSEAARLQLGML